MEGGTGRQTDRPVVLCVGGQHMPALCSARRRCESLGVGGRCHHSPPPTHLPSAVLPTYLLAYPCAGAPGHRRPPRVPRRQGYLLRLRARGRPVGPVRTHAQVAARPTLHARRPIRTRHRGAGGRLSAHRGALRPRPIATGVPRGTGVSVSEIQIGKCSGVCREI